MNLLEWCRIELNKEDDINSSRRRDLNTIFLLMELYKVHEEFVMDRFTDLYREYKQFVLLENRNRRIKTILDDLD